MSSSAEERRPASPHHAVEAPHSVDLEGVCLWNSLDHAVPIVLLQRRRSTRTLDGGMPMEVDGPCKSRMGFWLPGRIFSLPENSLILNGFRANNNRLGPVGTSLPGMGHVKQALVEDPYLVLFFLNVALDSAPSSSHPHALSFEKYLKTEVGAVVFLKKFGSVLHLKPGRVVNVPWGYTYVPLYLDRDKRGKLHCSHVVSHLADSRTHWEVANGTEERDRDPMGTPITKQHHHRVEVFLLRWNRDRDAVERGVFLHVQMHAKTSRNVLRNIFKVCSHVRSGMCAAIKTKLFSLLLTRHPRHEAFWHTDLWTSLAMDITKGHAQTTAADSMMRRGCSQ